MKLVSLLAVIIATVVVHNTNADSPDDNWGTTRCRKRECEIGINGVSRCVEAHSPHRIP